ncbi:MAG: RNA polymerase sigma-70 factor [Cytophagales bacterium]|nr:RNA polymerase sigma-70 factor [Cytophagales bacterium]
MQSDKQYIKRLISEFVRYHDKAAFKQFYDIYYPKLINFARLFLRDFSLVQEVVSDVFYKILQNPSLLEQSNDIDNYLFISVKNQAINCQKRVKVFGNYSSVEDVKDYLIPEKSNPEKILVETELYDVVWKIVEEMPPKRRTIYMMIKEDGMKYKQVAKLLDISVKTVESHMHEAMKPIRKAVKDYLDSKDVNVRQLRGEFYLFSFFL